MRSNWKSESSWYVPAGSMPCWLEMASQNSARPEAPQANPPPTTIRWVKASVRILGSTVSSISELPCPGRGQHPTRRTSSRHNRVVPVAPGNFVGRSFVQSEAVVKHRACSALQLGKHNQRQIVGLVDAVHEVHIAVEVVRVIESAPSLQLLRLLRLLQWESGRRRARCCFLFSLFSPFLPLRPFPCRALPARL